VTAEPITRYVVIRPAADLPPGTLHPDWDGRWLLRDPGFAVDRTQFDQVAFATGRYETRDDGERAEVFEVRATHAAHCSPSHGRTPGGRGGERSGRREALAEETRAAGDVPLWEA